MLEEWVQTFDGCTKLSTDENESLAEGSSYFEKKEYILQNMRRKSYVIDNRLYEFS